jgi:hypothetical protein
METTFESWCLFNCLAIVQFFSTGVFCVDLGVLKQIRMCYLSLFTGISRVITINDILSDLIEALVELWQVAQFFYFIAWLI